ncbi:hypothetical protein ANO14919_075880 [Xylariales sp. No.14919]|nr:hypothetical protein ANO14919_075880 [Xylariales sp. No.14919]
MDVYDWCLDILASSKSGGIEPLSNLGHPLTIHPRRKADVIEGGGPLQDEGQTAEGGKRLRM